MPLKIVFGRSGTGKSEYLKECVKDAMGNGKKALLIVPEQFSFVKEKEVIKKTGYISDDLKVASFKRLSFDVIREKNASKTVLDKTKKSMIIAKVIYSLKDELVVFGNMHKRQGFINVVQDMISEFKRSCAQPDEIRNHAQNIENNPLLKAKLHDFSLIYEKYQEIIDKEFIDDDDNITLLAKGTENKDMSDTEIFIDEFFRFTQAELKCIEAFLKAGATVSVALCAENANVSKNSLFAPVITTYHTLISIAKQTGAEILPTVFLENKHRFKDSKELLHLENEYPKFKNNIYKEETHDISLFIASDLYSEMSHLACDILKSVQEENIRFKDIAVICGDPESYRNIIKNVFDIYDIPIFIDTKKDLLGHPVIIMIFSVLDIMKEGLETKHILSYIKSGYSTLSREKTDIFENFVLSGNVKKADWTDDERFLKRAKSVFDDSENLAETDAEFAEKLILMKECVLKPLLKLKDNISKSRKACDRADAISEFFEDISLRDKIKKETDFLFENKESENAEAYAKVYNILMETLESFKICMGNESVGIDRMYDIITAGLSQCNISIIPPINDGVFFGDLSRSIARNVKRLYIIGANEGTFPPNAPIENVLNDAERIYLSQKGLSLAPDTKKMMFDYGFMVYNILNISKEKLYISYPISDLSGEGKRPSSLVSKIKKIFPLISLETDIEGKKENPKDYVLTKKSAFNYIIKKKERNEEEEKIYNILMEDEHYREKLKSTEYAVNYKNIAQRLLPDVVKNLYRDNLKGSVSSFEKYSACPFSYFLTYGLSAKERKLFDVDTPDFGSLLHRVIDVFSKKISSSKKKFSEIEKEECEIIVSDILDEITGKMFINKLYSEKKMILLIKRLKKYAFRATWAICEHIKRGEFEPCAFEAEFSQNGDMAPLEIELPTGAKITLVGKIDRIDKYEHAGELYVKVIDYKTGKKDFSLSDIFNKLSLQLCVYIATVCENGEKLLGAKPKTAGMFYFKLSDTPIETNGTEEVSDERRLADFKMSGMVLDNKQIIDAMERGISGYSSIIPVRIGKEGEIVKSSSKTASLYQFEKLKEYVKKTAGEIGKEILDGKVDISPCANGKDMPCAFCKFHSICGFDINKDPYRQVGKIKNDVIWDMFEEN